MKVAWKNETTSYLDTLICKANVRSTPCLPEDTEEYLLSIQGPQRLD
jgi:hypothetical protein